MLFRKIVWVKGIFIIGFLCFLGSLAQSQSFSALDSKLSELVEEYDVNGISAAVRFSDGAIWKLASGNHGANGPLTPDMLFEVGSITKTFTAAMILQMVQEQKLSLDDTLGYFFDQLVNIDPGVTIRQLLNHTSGIFSYDQHSDVRLQIFLNPEKVWTPEEILKDYVSPMVFEAGTDWSYSNTNYLLLGLIIEQIDSTDYEMSLRKRLLDPYGLEHTYLDVAETYQETRSGSWMSAGSYREGKVTAILSGAWAAGGIVATASDLVEWAQLLYSGKVLGNAWTDSMVQATRIDTQVWNYGLGTLLRTENGQKLYGHNGNTYLQHATFEHCAHLGFSLAICINQEGMDNILQQKIRVELLDYLMMTVTAEPSLPSLASAIEIYPNPGSQYIILQFPSIACYEVEILQGDGKLKYKTETNSSGLSINVQDWPTGVYYIRITGNHSLDTRKWIKR